MAQPSLESRKMKLVGKACVNGQTPPKSEVWEAENGAFTTLPPGAERAPSKSLKEK